jgi:DNA-binding response OmpR family regulator
VDSGIGIAPENQDKIFERFYRVENDPAVYEVSGTGLGLAITLSLIQMHGGDIWLESELGVGSIFTFSLPLAEGEPQDDVGAPPASLISPAPPLILVVEDDAEIAELLSVTFESEGMRVLVASSGEDALRLARRALPDFISLDVRLPDLDGIEVLQLLKRDPETADIPVTIVSVVADRDKGLAMGALDYLTKPLDTQRLLEVIRRTLDPQKTVLIAHTDKAYLNRLRSRLQLEGLNVRTANRAERALHLARDLCPQVIVTAFELPDMDYQQLASSLRRHQRTAEIPVIVTSVPEHLVQSDAATRQDLGDVRFLTPALSSVEQLGATLAAFFGGNGSSKGS